MEFVNRCEILLRKWQKILRLQDWDIRLKVVRWNDIIEEALGQHSSRLNTRDSLIKLRNPTDHPTNEDFPNDFDEELTIVHELLHVKLVPLQVPRTYTIEQEQIVESLARILLFQDRLIGKTTASEAADKSSNLFPETSI